jgi:predicted ATP-grasp superfamily ATP-dependent carboligase
VTAAGAARSRGGQPGVVVLGSDFRALAVVRSLGRRGIPTVLVDSLPRSAWFSRYVRSRYRWDGPMEGPALVDHLVALAARHALEGWLLYPLYDDAVETVARHAEALARAYRLTTPSWASVHEATDKRLAYEAARQAGVPVPRTWYPGGPDEVRSLPLDFPAIVKPASSGPLQAAARRKAFKAADREELLEAYRLAVGFVGAEGLMVQELVPGGGADQLSVGAFCREGEVLASMTARRTRQYPVDFGLGSCFVEAVPVPGLEPLAAALVRRLGLSGMVEVEFKRDARDGSFRLLDVNVRAWGWHGLCLDCGLDFPYLQYRETLGLSLPPSRAVYGHRWRRLLTDLPAALTEMRRGTLSPLAYARSFVGPTARSVLDVRDPLPALGDLWVAGARALAAARRPAPEQGASRLAAPVSARSDP